MSKAQPTAREGGLDAPTRHPIEWQSEAFWDKEACDQELERVFDICHGCRRCVNLCASFPTLFDLVDESPTLEVDGVDKADYQQVVDQCYLCDLCYQTKCPYVPPHPWALDYPHLMLRAKAIAQGQPGADGTNGSGKSARHRLRDRLMTSPDAVGKALSIPLLDVTANALTGNKLLRKCLQTVTGIHAEVPLPTYHAKTAHKLLDGRKALEVEPAPAGPTRGQVAVFSTCSGVYNLPEIVADLVAVLEHNQVPATLLQGERCCGMPKLELGDLAAVQRARDTNIPVLLEAIEAGWDIIAPVPSCVLMFKQELPLLFADDAEVQKVKEHIFDPFEYLAHRHRAGLLNTEFKTELGRVAYQVACHQRVQNIGPRTRELLELIPGTEIETIERCSGHDGTYAIREETYEQACKIARPVVRKVEAFKPDHLTSDCPLAASHIKNNLGADSDTLGSHPLSLFRLAYSI